MLVLVLVQAGAQGAGVHMSGSSVCACVRMRACACASEPRRARAQVCTLYKLDDVMLKGLLAHVYPPPEQTPRLLEAFVMDHEGRKGEVLGC